MTVYYEFTNEGLKQLFSELLAQPDFLTVSRRRIVTSFLCTHLHVFGYVAMTHEELILRKHYEFLGADNGKPEAKAVDVFQHVNLFLQLGIASHEVLARTAVKKTIDNLVELEMLKRDTGSDGQADFATTRLVNPKLSIDEAVHELNRKIK